jgi:1-acyl-sn-glycerol-3-phosphate acyltransferase
MQVRIGEPIDPNTASAAELRAQVLALRESLAPDAVNRYALAA